MSIKNLYPTSDPDFRVDFVNGRRVPPEVRFTRDTIGTYVGRDGLIKTALPNEPRYTHDPIIGRELGLLVEESSINAIKNSFDTSNSASWVNNGVITTPNQPSPDGQNNATLIQQDTSNSTHSIDVGKSSNNLNNYYILFTINSICTCSIFVKKFNVDRITIAGNRFVGFGSSGYTSAGVVFDFSTESIVKTINWSNSSFDQLVGINVDKYSDGWYRISYSFRVGTDSNGPRIDLAIYPHEVSTVLGTPVAIPSGVFGIDGANYDANVIANFTGDGISGVYIWGAQIEQGSYPTSYIPTSGSAVTRSPDIATLPNSTGAIFDPGAFDIINQPFGVSSGSNELTFTTSAPVKSTLVYSPNISQAEINTLASKTDDFWRWRVTGSSFGLPTARVNGSGVTLDIDWGDGTIENYTAGVISPSHTYTDGEAYHEIGFKLNGDGSFQPAIYNDATHRNKLIAIGPAPESMKISGPQAFWGCANLIAFDATVNFGIVGSNLNRAWQQCASLKSFPLINTSGIIDFSVAWSGCTSLTSFPLIDTSSGTNFGNAWSSCSSLTSFPLIDTSSGTNFQSTWQNCSSLTSFPLLDTSSGTSFNYTWSGCSSLTTFPLIDTSSGTNFTQTWRNCSSLTSFPVINISSGTTFNATWENCNSLTSFPANFFDYWTGTPINNCFGAAWKDCSSLTSTSVENILNSIDTSGQSAPASGVDITIDYYTSTGTPNISAAVANLKSRGWTITLNGVAQ